MALCPFAWEDVVIQTLSQKADKANDFNYNFIYDCDNLRMLK